MLGAVAGVAPALAREHGRDAAVRQYRALQDTVAEVGRVVAADGLAADWAAGGTVTLARSRAAAAPGRRGGRGVPTGFGFEDLELLDAAEAPGGWPQPRCSAGCTRRTARPIHPARLARVAGPPGRGAGRADLRADRALGIEPGRVRTEHGDLRADLVLRATEGFSARLPGLRRSVAPVYSLMIATEPLPAEAWQRLGLAARETFADFRHLIVYGQRSADGRLLFGGRGAPYHFGSRISPRYDRVPAVFAALRSTLGELLPAVRGGADQPQLGRAAGDQPGLASLGRAGPASGLGWAGGYVGDGVATSNLAGRTLADLALGRDSDLTGLPWVGHRSRPGRWNRYGGWVPMPGCRRCAGPTGPKSAAAGSPGWPPW